MHVLILGAAGMLGRKLANALGVAGTVGETAMTRLTNDLDLVITDSRLGSESRAKLGSRRVPVELAADLP